MPGPKDTPADEPEPVPVLRASTTAPPAGPSLAQAIADARTAGALW